MSVMHRARRLAGLAGGTALTLGIAAAAVAPAPAAFAQARSILPVVNHHAAASWGLNNAGQLGNGTTTISALYGGVSGLGTGVVQVSAGANFGPAVTSAGTVRAWGDNTWGQLGNGTVNGSLTPVQVTGLSGIIQVAAGSDFGLALRSDGTVWGWGRDGFGQLGDGQGYYYQLTPVQVTGLTGVTKIAAGGSFGLALRNDGTVWAWGDNPVGELGNGTTTRSLAPVQVKGLSHVTSIAAGGWASLAIRASGITALTTLWAWGGNLDGQLGDGTTTNHLTPEQVTGITAPGIAAITAGEDFAEALGSDGSVWGWGDDQVGQLGFAPPAASFLILKPVETTGAGSLITQLSAGAGHTLALQSNGTVLAWGANEWGELGNGTRSYGPTRPVQVTGLTSVSQVSAGDSLSLAVYPPPLYR